ncbi:MAG: HAD family hydrolase [Acidimicrobiales bacterium]
MSNASPQRPAPRVLLLDFNGTLSDDEDLLYEIFAELFASHGRPLTRQQYFSELVGRSDRDIVCTVLGAAQPGTSGPGTSGPGTSQEVPPAAVQSLLDRRGASYRARAGGGSTVCAATRQAVHLAAADVPLGIVSGASRADVDLVLAGAELAECFSVIVTEEDFTRGKPDPEGYLCAFKHLSSLGLAASPAEVLVLEDSAAGVQAARAAGMRCVGVTRARARPGRSGDGSGGPAAPEVPGPLAGAEEIVAGISVEIVARLLGHRRPG